MILNLKNKRAIQMDSLAHLGGKAHQMPKSHREMPLERSRDSNEIKSTRVNSNAAQRKPNATSIASTSFGPNSSSHTNVASHFSYYHEPAFDKTDNAMYGNSSQAKNDIGKAVNAYRKMKKQDNQYTHQSSLVLKEASKQKRSSAHKSQKISHKRQLIGNLTNNYILVTEPVEDIRIQPLILEKAYSQLLKRRFSEPLLFLFGGVQGLSASKPLKGHSRSKSYREYGSMRRKEEKTITINCRDRKKEQSQILIKDSSTNSNRIPESQNISEDENFGVEGFLQKFIGRIEMLQQNRKQSGQGEGKSRKTGDTSFSSTLQACLDQIVLSVKSFMNNFVQKSLQTNYASNEFCLNLARELSKQQQLTQDKCRLLSSEVLRLQSQNKNLLQQFKSVQRKSINCMTIFNELSAKFDLEDFVKKQFTSVEAESNESLNQSYCDSDLYEKNNQEKYIFEQSGKFSKHKQQFLQNMGKNQQSGIIYHTNMPKKGADRYTPHIFGGKT